MMRKKRASKLLLKKAKLSGVEPESRAIRCRECGVCPDCADSVYDQYGYIIRAVAAQVRLRYEGALPDTVKWISLMEEQPATPRTRTLLKPYLEDLAAILAAAKIHNHPVMFFLYAMKVVNHPGFDITRDLEKLLPWNLEDYFSDYVTDAEINSYLSPRRTARR